MSKSSIGRVLGFVGAVGVSAALVGVAATGTGAYFTDSADGEVNGTVGTIELTAGDTEVTLDKILPGEKQTDAIRYMNTGSREQDVWIVFENTAALQALSPSQAAVTVTVPGVDGDVTFPLTSLMATCPANPNANSNASAACKVPAAKQIQLRKGLPSVNEASSSLVIGMPATATNQAEWTNGITVPFTLVATQPGIAPGA